MTTVMSALLTTGVRRALTLAGFVRGPGGAPGDTCLVCEEIEGDPCVLNVDQPNAGHLRGGHSAVGGLESNF